MGFTLILERSEGSEGDEPVVFVPGKPQGPISVGRDGQYHLDGPGVLTVHAYLMWDGKGFYVASANEANPAIVEGIRITKDWTRVEPPCSILLGRTMMMLRMVTTAEPTIVYAPTEQRPQLALPRHDYHLGRPLPITAPHSESTIVLPAASPPQGVPVYHDVTPSEPTRQTRARPPFQDVDPLGLPSFSVGSGPDSEATRVHREGSPLPVLRPAAGDNESTRLHNEAWQPKPGERYPVALLGTEGMAQEPTAPAPGRPIPSDYIPAGQPGYIPPGPVTIVPRQQQQMVQPEARTLPAPAPVAPTEPAPETKRPPRRRSSASSRGAGAKMRAAMAPGAKTRLPIIIALSMTMAVLVFGTTTLVRYLNRPAELPQLPARPAPPIATTTEPSAAPQPPSPGIVLYPAPARKALDASVRAHSTDDPRRPIAGDAGPPTLERSAIDAINRGDFTAALNAYRQLSQQQPDNPAFANAMRLLQQKLNSESPPSH